MFLEVTTIHIKGADPQRLQIFLGLPTYAYGLPTVRPTATKADRVTRGVGACF